MVLPFLLASSPPAVWAAPSPAQLLRVRHWTDADHTRVVLDVSGPAKYRVTRGEASAGAGTAGARLVVDLPGVALPETAAVAVGDGRVLQILRSARPPGARVVLVLAGERPVRHFALPAADGRPDRIVIDVRGAPGPAAETAAQLTDPEPVARELAAAAPLPATADLVAEVEEPEAEGVPDATPLEQEAGPAVATPAALAEPPTAAATARSRLGRALRPDPDGKPFTVIVDPGHGGLDPGAVRSGVREKDVALSVARKVADLLNSLPGYRAVLTREGDYFISLGRRVRTAREREGDLFLSVHANTHPRPQTAGMEVYFLSLEGATDREAQELADKENAADLVGLGADERRDDAVISILMDLRMSRVLSRSSALAERILAAATARELGTRRVKQARFQVLRSLAMPSALVELAYLSHPEDRALLKSSDGQRRLAETVVDGILRYREDSEALAILAAGVPWARRYQVQRGDTLWALARRHRTTVQEIRQRNNLASGELLVGQQLQLPLADRR